MQQSLVASLLATFLFLSNVSFASTYTITPTNSFYCIGGIGNYQAMTATCDCGGGTATVEWWDAETGGNLLATDSLFSPIGLGLISSTVDSCYTFYAGCNCTSGCTGTREKAVYRVLDCGLNNTASSCTYMLVLEDSGHDGWDGASMDVSINEAAAINYKVTPSHCGGSYNVVPLHVDDGGTIDITYWNGAFEWQHAYKLYDPNLNIEIAYTSNPPANVQNRVNANCTESCVDFVVIDLQIEMGTNPSNQSWAIYEATPSGGLGNLYLNVNGLNYGGFVQGDQVNYTIPLDKCIEYAFVASSTSGTGWDSGTWRITSNNPTFGTLITDPSDALFGNNLLIDGPADASFSVDDQVNFTIPCPSAPNASQSLVGNASTCLTTGMVNVSLPSICFPYTNNTTPISCVTDTLIVQKLGNPNDTLVFTGTINYGTGQASLSNLPSGNHNLIQKTTYCDGIVTNLFSELLVTTDANPTINCEPNLVLNFGTPDPSDDDNMNGNTYADDLGECILAVTPAMVLNLTPICPEVYDEYFVTILAPDGNPLIVYDANGLALDAQGNPTLTGTPAHNLLSPAESAQTLAYVVEHTFSGNQCWGTVTAEDNENPLLSVNDYDINCTHPHYLDEYYSHIDTFSADNLPYTNITNTADVLSSTFIPIDLPKAALGEIIQDIQIQVDLTHADYSDLEIKIHAPSTMGLPASTVTNTVANTNNFNTTNSSELLSFLELAATNIESISSNNLIEELGNSQTPSNLGNTWYIELIDSHDTSINPLHGNGIIDSVSISLTMGFPAPYAAYDCTLVSVTFSEQVVETNCDQSDWNGSIIERVWEATDVQGQISTALQTVDLKAPTMDQIEIPADLTLAYTGQIPTDMTPDITDYPSFGNFNITADQHDLCDISYTYEDVVEYTCGNGFVITREWLIVIWCSGVNEQSIQTISIDDNSLSYIVCPSDTAFCDLTMACEAIVGLSINASCTNTNLTYAYEIDQFNDGSINFTGSGNAVSGIYPFGTHTVYWTVTDISNNSSTCTQVFTTADCKNPTPVCLNGYYVNVPPSACTTVPASDLLEYAFDNCSSDAYVEASVKARLVGDTNPPETSILLCSSNPGLNLIEIWVEDEAGNADYCTTYADVQIEVCPNTVLLDANPIATDSYFADETIISTGTIPSTNAAIFQAGQTICLDAGFEVILGGEFQAVIGPCVSTLEESEADNQ